MKLFRGERITNRINYTIRNTDTVRDTFISRKERADYSRSDDMNMYHVY